AVCAYLPSFPTRRSSALALCQRGRIQLQRGRSTGKDDQGTNPDPPHLPPVGLEHRLDAAGLCVGEIEGLLPTFIVHVTGTMIDRSEEHTSELQSRENLVC